MIRTTGTSGLSNMKLNKTSISINNEKITNSKNNIKTDNIIDMGIQYGCGSAMYGCGAVIRPTMTTEQLNEAFNESLRKQRAEEMRREVERINSEEEEEVSFFGCVLDTLTGYGEDISDAYDATKSFVTDAASTVGDFYDYTIDYTSDKMVEIEEKVNNAVDTVKDVYDYTIDYTSDKIGEISDAVTEKINYVGNKLENLFVDGVEGFSKIFATIGNASLSFTKGALSLVEGLGDTAILAAGGIGSIFTFSYDMGHLLFTGELGTATDKWTNAYTGKIAYSWVDDIDETLELREGLDEYSYDLFDSDGTGSMVAEGVGETVGILAMVMSTGGAGAVTLTTSTTVSVPTALAVVSGTSGIGTHTEEGFNEIINQNQQQEAYKRLENVEVTQEMYEEKLKEMKAREDKEYTNEEVLNEIYSDLYIEELNKVKASGEYNSLNGTDVSKGVAYGVGNAGIDAAQWYAGGKINTISPFNGKAANILTRVGLDTADAMVEVPAREATKMLYREDIEGNKMSFSEIWKEDGATRQLGVQAVLGGGGSLIGEGVDLAKQKNKIQLDAANVESKLTKDATAKLTSREIESMNAVRNKLNMSNATDLQVAQEVNRITKNLDFDKLDIKQLDISTMKKLSDITSNLDTTTKKNVLTKITSSKEVTNFKYIDEYNVAMEQFTNSMSLNELNNLDISIKTNVEDFMKKRVKTTYGMDTSNIEINKLYELYEHIDDSVSSKKVISVGNIDNELSKINSSSLSNIKGNELSELDEISVDIIRNNSLDSFIKKFDYNNLDNELKQVLDERIIKEQNQIAVKLSSDSMNSYSELKTYIDNQPELVSKMSTENLVRISAYSKNMSQTIFDELKLRVKNGEMIFKNTPIEINKAFIGKVGDDTYLSMVKLANIDEGLYMEVRQMYYDNYKKYIPEDINTKLDLDNQPLYSKMGIAELFEKNNIDENGIRILNSMEGNAPLIKSFDYRMLRKDIIDDFGEDFVKDIGRYTDLSTKIIYLKNSNPKVYSSLKEMINNSLLDDSLGTSAININNSINFMFYNADVLEKSIEHTNLTMLQNYINLEAKIGSKNIPSFSNDFLIEFSKNNNLKAQRIMDEMEKSLSSKYTESLAKFEVDNLKEVYYNEFFQTDSKSINNLIKKYGSNLDYLEKNIVNEDVKKSIELLKFIEEVDSIEDPRIMMDLYRENNIRISAEELSSVEEALRKEYVDTYLKSFSNTNNYISNNTNIINVDGKNIKVVDFNDDFALLVHSSDTGFTENKVLINDSFKDTFSFTSDSKVHSVSTSFITQDNIGSAPVGKNGVLYGFTDMNNLDIQEIGITDINSNIANYGFSSGGTQKFVPAEMMSSETFRMYNEVVLNRDKVKPSCVVLYSDATEDVINNTYKAAVEWEIPVVKIDVDSLAQKQISKINGYLDAYKNTGDISNIDNAIKSYESNVSGFNLNATEAIEKFSNVHSSVEKYFNMESFEKEMIDIARDLNKNGTKEQIEQFADSIIKIQEKYKSLNDIYSPITKTKTSIDYDKILKELYLNE